ncbi:MAG: Gfo/Idh/MocA family oxidoreductase [Fuerstiella sp.]|jgi:predicted dehydrogenase|nr:Gfo/Idh/MocA family oxidoreductase [Fuerstiella sp.]MCP4506770.1 Gfo/Idh/MocA family oxidoreductase [Fuerstiella sp.]MDG2128992.1 Gfo/Idh/MocA family oxidoreductase [Fuerstiella sp.]
MLLTPEQEQIGKDNFHEVVGVSRRDFMKTAAAAGTGLGALYFGYSKLEGKPVRTAFIGTGDEGNVLINEHPTDYMEIVAIADLRPANQKRTFTGSHPVARRGLNAVLGRAKADNVAKNVFSNHRDLLAKKDELGLEAVVIAVPLNQHAPIAIECLEAGLHVICEKLMAQNVTDCKRMIRAAEERDLMLAVGHQRHYSVLYDNAAHLTNEMELLGDIKFIRAQWHRNNSFPGSDAWQKWNSSAKEDRDLLTKMEQDGSLKAYGYETARKLIDWRLYNSTGGGLMAELGSHQMDAASIFLGKKHPLAVQGYGGKNFFGMEGVGPESAWKDDRDIDDQIFVTFEFPGKTHEKNERDVAVVTYSSMNTNRWEPYGEAVFGSRGTLWMKTEKEALLYKESSKDSPGGVEQRIWMVDSKGSGPVLDSYETSAPSAAASGAQAGMGEKISRGYREEMEHFCYCVRTGKNELRCNGHVAMADAIMALTGNLAMKHKKRIEFKPEWFDASSDACPEEDEQVTTA